LTQNAESDTGEASAFVNAYVSGGSMQLASASIRVLPNAEWVTITGNNLGGASSGLRETDFGVHSAANNVIAFGNNVQRVNRAPYQSINNNRTNASRYNLGLAVEAGKFDPYQVDGVLSFTQAGAVSVGTKNFNTQRFIAGCKIRIVRITRNLSSAPGNSVTARFLVNGVLQGGNLTQDGNTVTDDLLGTPVVVDGTVAPQLVQLSVTAATGTPTDFIFEAQYQIITG
jgi:hypothetical protein